MAGRRPKPVEEIKGNRSKKELADRKKLQPSCNSQTFAAPKELTPEETEKWHEIVNLIKSFKNSPNSDADKDTMINYCKAWVRFIKTDKKYQEKPDDKENYKQMMDNAKLLAKLKSDLMLDPVSRIKMGNTSYINGQKPKDDKDDFFD